MLPAACDRQAACKAVLADRAVFCADVHTVEIVGPDGKTGRSCQPRASLGTDVEVALVYGRPLAHRFERQNVCHLPRTPGMFDRLAGKLAADRTLRLQVMR